MSTGTIILCALEVTRFIIPNRRKIDNWHFSELLYSPSSISATYSSAELLHAHVVLFIALPSFRKLKSITSTLLANSVFHLLYHYL